MAIQEYKSTGSLSMALWPLSYETKTEAALAAKMLDARRSQNWYRAMSLASDLVGMNPSAPNYWDLGFATSRYAERSLSASQTDLRIQYLDEAKESFRKAIEVDPKFAPAYSPLAAASSMSYMGQNVYTDQIDEWFGKAIEYDANWAFSQMNKAISLMDVYRYDEAYEAVVESIVVNPKFPEQEYRIEVFTCIAIITKKTVPEDIIEKYNINMSRKPASCMV